MGRDPDGKAKIINVDENGNVKVQLSGKIVTETTIFPRSLRTAGIPLSAVSVPQGATGAVFMLNVYGITGTFETGEGIKATLYIRNTKGTAFGMLGCETSISKDVRNHMIIVDKGASYGDAVVMSPGLVKMLGVPLCEGMALAYIIHLTGTFEQGQGVDCEGVVKWLY